MFETEPKALPRIRTLTGEAGSRFVLEAAQHCREPIQSVRGADQGEFPRTSSKNASNSTPPCSAASARDCSMAAWQHTFFSSLGLHLDPLTLMGVSPCSLTFHSLPYRPTLP